MCGIVGYIGKNNAVPVIINGLKNLEYRGYDSAGIAMITPQGFDLKRCKGKVAALETMLSPDETAHIGIGHTRWATHGVPSEENAHPHSDCYHQIMVVHNGIIENHTPLKEMLISEGHQFQSDTDTEVIAHLIERYYKGDLYDAVFKALAIVEGAYALAVLHVDRPDEIVVAKYHSPLVLGVGDQEYFIASDVPAILQETQDIIYPEDGEIGIISKDGIILKNAQQETVHRAPVKVTWNHEMAQKGGYANFMLKEIFEQPQAIEETINSCISEQTESSCLNDIGLSDEEIRSITRIVIISCGTSWHAGLIGKLIIERFARIPVSVEYASEFRYTDPIVDANTLTIGITQSGETADTLAGIREAKKRGSRVIAICNVVGSSIAREVDGVIYTHAGPEIGVASTKAFTAQLAVLYLMGVSIARAHNRLLISDSMKMITALKGIQEKIYQTLKLSDTIEKIAEEFYQENNFIYMGRGLGFAMALEGALKLKEISYIHAEGYHAGEMKHGPIALVDAGIPIVVLALKGRRYNKIINNIEEVKARGGRVIAIATEGDRHIGTVADRVIYIPEIDEFLSPIIAAIPLQFLAYYIACKRGCNIDQPRNLAKSVTVE